MWRIDSLLTQTQSLTIAIRLQFTSCGSWTRKIICKITRFQEILDLHPFVHHMTFSSNVSLCTLSLPPNYIFFPWVKPIKNYKNHCTCTKMLTHVNPQLQCLLCVLSCSVEGLQLRPPHNIRFALWRFRGCENVTALHFIYHICLSLYMCVSNYVMWLDGVAVNVIFQRIRACDEVAFVWSWLYNPVLSVEISLY